MGITLPEPNARSQRNLSEIRPLYEITDFGEAMTPELREQEERLRQ